MTKDHYSAIMNRDGAYAFHSKLTLIEGTQRIPSDHPMDYWREGGAVPETILYENIDHDFLSNAYYVGRIPLHFGHFLMEALPRLSDLNMYPMFVPVGYITPGNLPPEKRLLQVADVEWLISTLTYEKLYQIEEEKIARANCLRVAELPYVLSYHCAHPERMKGMIDVIVRAARKKHPDIEVCTRLYLCRKEDDVTTNVDGCKVSDIHAPLSAQIAQISLARELQGYIGSNTHLSLFANRSAQTFWKSRGSYESDRNQAICDLVKSYNAF